MNIISCNFYCPAVPKSNLKLIAGISKAALMYYKQTILQPKREAKPHKQFTKILNTA